MLRFFVLFASISLAVPCVWALPEDSQQPIHVVADYVEQRTEEERTVVTYTGNVVITQGSRKLMGDAVTVYGQQYEVLRLTADGMPAAFAQQRTLAHPVMTAYARHIEYNVADETILLVGDAKVEQGASMLEGPRIEYHLVTEQVKAGRTEEDSSRVYMVLDPEDRIR